MLVGKLELKQLITGLVELLEEQKINHINHQKKIITVIIDDSLIHFSSRKTKHSRVPAFSA